MTYLVTARKWRPMVFEDIVGQSHITKTLKNAIATSRISHAYLFSGPRGVGKTTTARILAKAVNCRNPRNSDPDNECDLCTEITESRSVNVFEIDGASNRGVDDVRNLREAVRYGPAKGAYKVYIIDEVHMLTKEAFNALLKTLEEPPAYVIFIFATTEIHKVPLTILSRCQRFDFRRIPIDEITTRLRTIADTEKVSIDNDALFLIAKRSDGSMRDAQSIFDQVVSFSGECITAESIRSMLNIVDEEIYFRVTEIISAKDIKAGLQLANEVIDSGYDVREFLGGLTEHFRNFLITLTTGSANLIEASDETKQRYLNGAKTFTENDLLRLIAMANATESSIRWSQSAGGGRIKLEIGLVQMIKMDSSVEINRLLDQLDDLKKSLNGGSGGSRELQFRETSTARSKETAVRGSVKASPSPLRADQVVASSPMNTVDDPDKIGTDKPTMALDPAVQYFTTQPAVLQHVSTPAGDIPLVDDSLRDRRSTRREAHTTSVVSETDAHGKWSMLVDEARKQRIHVGTALGEASLIGVSGNRLKIGCPDDFHLESLSRNRQFLQELAQQVYGARVQLEAIVSSQPTVREKRDSQPVNSIHQHPVIQALIREFGAKEVD